MTMFIRQLDGSLMNLVAEFSLSVIFNGRRIPHVVARVLRGGVLNHGPNHHQPRVHRNPVDRHGVEQPHLGRKIVEQITDH